MDWYFECFIIKRNMNPKNLAFNIVFKSDEGAVVVVIVW